METSIVVCTTRFFDPRRCLRAICLNVLMEITKYFGFCKEEKILPETEATPTFPMSALVRSRLSLMIGTRGATTKVEIKVVKKEIHERFVVAFCLLRFAKDTALHFASAFWFCDLLLRGHDNAFNDDVDEQPIQDLALNMDNVFQADDCDAFDSDVDEAPTAQTMFMANLSSADPVTDEAEPSYDSNILSEVQDHNQYMDDVCAHHEEHVMHDSVQLDHVVD
nr:integrase, catalytic region, zinc finger, CCHC-type, peptidase aspartic, catalytic [Tanacetum cinerariifolium]